MKFPLLKHLGLRQPAAMRILIAKLTTGGGQRAAAALEEAWRAARPNDVIERLDLVKFFSPLHKKIHEDGCLRPGQWPSFTSESLWQMPQAWTLIRAWPARGWGISRSTISNGPPGRVTWATRILGIKFSGEFLGPRRPRNLAHFWALTNRNIRDAQTSSTLPGGFVEENARRHGHVQ